VRIGALECEKGRKSPAVNLSVGFRPAGAIFTAGATMKNQTTHIISVVNGKGGSGKTTLSISMAMILAQTSRVLLIDLDPQCSASVATGCYNNGRDLSHVFMGDELEANISDAGGFDILAGSVKMSSFGTIPENTLRRNLAPIRGEYDFIIIDSQGAVTNLMRMAIAAADIILIPTRLNVVDYDTVRHTFTEISAMEFEGPLGIVMNAIKDRTKPWTQEKIDTFREDSVIGEYVLQTMIGEMVSLEKALSVEDYTIPFAARVIIENLIREVLA
jgi:cellulose biosynthesis protein BcsQ